MINTDKNLIMRFGRQETGTPLMSEFFGSNQWINYGVNNDFPQELIRLYQNSSIMHTRLINLKADMIAGNGFDQESDFLLNSFSKDSYRVIAKKCALDKVLFGGFYLNIIWDKSGKKIAQVEHLPFEKMRIAKYDCDAIRNEYQLEGYYFSKDWLRHRRSENKPVFLPEFNPEYSKELPSQVMFFKTYSPGLDYYTLPSYNAALNALKLDYEISTYHLKNVQNGLMPGMIIVNKSGMPTAEERQQIYDETKARYSGADNAGDFLMVYAESPDKTPDFIPVQLNSSDQRFKDLDEKINRDVMVAHQMTSAVAGIETAGKLGATQEIMEQLIYAQNTLISPLQLDLEEAINKIAKINGIDEVFTLKKYKIYDEQTVSMSMDRNIQKIKLIN